MSEFVNEFINQISSISLIKFFQPINEIVKLVLGSSILNINLKYCITYPIVGVILVIIKSPNGKKDSLIGKILYFLVGYIIGFVLDYISEMIFN